MTTYQLYPPPSRRAPAAPPSPKRRGELSRFQKMRICMAAAEAAKRKGIFGCQMVDAWRHEETHRLIGITSLTQANQTHYADLLTHFQALAGETSRAFNTAMRGSDNPRRVARWKLNEALREGELRQAYAAAICWRQYRCALAEATEAQLWRLVYTIKNRVNARKKKGTL